MLRSTLTILSLIGLMLSLALWGVSNWRIKYRTNRGQFLVWNGKIGYDRYMAGSHVRTDTKRFPRGWVVYGLRKSNRFSTILTPDFSRNPFGLGIPLWIPTLLFAVWPASLLLPFHRRRKRKKLGLCVKCGYDLRGSKNRCPECGTEFPKPSNDESEPIIDMNEKGCVQ